MYSGMARSSNEFYHLIKRVINITMMHNRIRRNSISLSGINSSALNVAKKFNTEI